MSEPAKLRVLEPCSPAGTRALAPEPSWKRIIVVSNRLPFKVTYDANKRPVVKASAGWLVTAMTPLLQRGIAGKWIGWPGGKEEEGLEEALRSSPGEFDVGVVTLTESEIADYYRGYANEVLSPLFTSEADKVSLPNAMRCWSAYEAVQRKFADKVLEDLTESDIVWVHDYHLMGVAKSLRERGAAQPVGFFLHLPFPTKVELDRLPQRRRLLADLLAYDVVGFQTKQFERRFIAAVRANVPNAVIGADLDGTATIHYRGHTSRLGAFPISIDANEFERQLYSSATLRNVARLRGLVEELGTRVIFNAGRQDYSKGFLEELLAFERLLEKRPQLVGTVVLVQLVIPSRGLIRAHREYKAKIIEYAERINKRYGRTLVRQLHRSMGRARYLAYLHLASVQSIPTRADGMNLVAKESAVVGNPLTVLVVGKNAGVAEEFGEHALLVDPEDTETFADTRYAALTMDEAACRYRKSALKGIVTKNDVYTWWSSEQEPLFQKVWDERFGS